jgi:hypothetical protein
MSVRVNIFEKSNGTVSMVVAGQDTTSRKTTQNSRLLPLASRNTSTFAAPDLPLLSFFGFAAPSVDCALTPLNSSAIATFFYVLLHSTLSFCWRIISIFGSSFSSCRLFRFRFLLTTCKRRRQRIKTGLVSEHFNWLLTQ